VAESLIIWGRTSRNPTLLFRLASGGHDILPYLGLDLKPPRTFFNDEIVATNCFVSFCSLGVLPCLPVFLSCYTAIAWP